MKKILGQKILMTRIFNDKGWQRPVTLIFCPKNTVTQTKTKQKEGYEALQIGVGEKKKLNKAEAGHLKDAKIKARRLYEIKTEDKKNVGDEIDLHEFKIGDKINVTGKSKGKGFAGTVKRHNFNTGPQTHGSHNYRQPGSIGMTGPQRVIKGMKMAGHLGNKKVTVKNLEIIDIDYEKSEVLILGAVPGANKSEVLIWNNALKSEEAKDES